MFRPINTDPVLADIIPEFLQNTFEDFRCLQAAHAAGDLERMNKVCHRILGTALSYGHEQLDELVRALKEKVNAAEHAAIEQQMQELRQYMQFLELKPGKILVVDDSENTIMVIKAYLKHSPLQVESASNGAEALERLQAEAFDFIFMDMQMPVLDGMQATRRLRMLEDQNGRKRNFVLALTASDLEEDRARALEAGCSDFMAKPIRRETLFAKIIEIQGRNQHD